MVFKRSKCVENTCEEPQQFRIDPTSTTQGAPILLTNFPPLNRLNFVPGSVKNKVHSSVNQKQNISREQIHSLKSFSLLICKLGINKNVGINHLEQFIDLSYHRVIPQLKLYEWDLFLLKTSFENRSLLLLVFENNYKLTCSDHRQRSRHFSINAIQKT